MCRSIKQLRRPEAPPTDEELRAAALQYVRKISGLALVGYFAGAGVYLLQHQILA